MTVSMRAGVQAEGQVNQKHRAFLPANGQRGKMVLLQHRTHQSDKETSVGEQERRGKWSRLPSGAALTLPKCS